ncbi:hypothetical protein P4C99_18605 [Pontiellaceae bacterium B1224]|nr:hypothetical protein [Pontiellaceae bacterium B1224]
MDIKPHNERRECELEVALLESKRDLESGSFFSESVADHIHRITDECT